MGPLDKRGWGRIHALPGSPGQMGPLAAQQVSWALGAHPSVGRRRPLGTGRPPPPHPWGDRGPFLSCSVSDPDAGMWVLYKTPLESWYETPSGKPGEEGAPEERPGPCSAPRLPKGYPAPSFQAEAQDPQIPSSHGVQPSQLAFPVCPSASSSVQGPQHASLLPLPHPVTPKPFLLEAEVPILRGDLSHPQISIPTMALPSPPTGSTAAPLEGAATSTVAGTHSPPPPHQRHAAGPAGASLPGRQRAELFTGTRAHTHTQPHPCIKCPAHQRALGTEAAWVLRASPDPNPRCDLRESPPSSVSTQDGG